MYTIYETVLMCVLIAGGGYMISKKARQIKAEAAEKAAAKEGNECLKDKEQGGEK